ncbi:helix-turn-helix transcriptional regulator [Actinomadura sp. HBU206391]|nr:helix-turn-helix transcriptional regulator [Actinomadura sp. HBU206391]
MSPPVGELFRDWRRRRRLSQLDLANEAGVSSRHVSFVETGRTVPSRRMVLHLAEHLGVPLRERNRLLVAAGYAPVYQERPFDGPDMAAARQAVERIVRGHEPYPALAVDRHWNLVLANSAAEVFLHGVDPGLLEPPVNMMRLGLHPRGFASRVINLPEVRAFLLTRLARQVQMTGDARMAALLDELLSYGPGAASPEQVLPEEQVPPGEHEVALPIRIRDGGRELSFFSAITTFGTALDITLAEIAIEAYFPADSATADLLRSREDSRDQKSATKPPVP